MEVGVLVSGVGTVLQAILDAGVPVAVVVSDRPNVPALERAVKAGIPVEVVDRTQYLPDREAFTDAVIDALAPYNVDIVAMAGFMTIMTKQIFEQYPNRIVNTHPSLLPAFRETYGEHTIQATLDAGVQLTGCTIHYATEQVDAGEILAQEAVPVLPNDTVSTLHERIKNVEWRLYPKILLELCGQEE